MAQWRRNKWKIEADLFPEQEGNLLGIAIRSKHGEIEIKGYDDGKAEMEIEFFGLKIPDNSIVSLYIDKKQIMEFQVKHGRYKKEHIKLQQLATEINIGSKVEIIYLGQTLLHGTFREDN